MKNTIIPAGVILAFSVLFASCGGPSGIAITKRHYRSGYYVNLGKKYKAPDVPKTTIVKQKTTVASLPVRIENVTTPVSNEETASLTPLKLKKAPVSDNKKTSHKSYPVTASVGKTFAYAPNYIPAATVSDALQGQGDQVVYVHIVPFWLVILCAIFIPPLGVFLAFGIIDIRFWIDLILTLLFFIPGMIFALIVILAD